MMMAMMVVASATAFAGDSDAFKASLSPANAVALATIITAIMNNFFILFKFLVIPLNYC